MNTREKIIILAREQILKMGYKGFSFNDISAPLNVKNAAIHYYFPTKEDLGLEVLNNEIERFQNWFANIEDLSCWQKLEAFFELYDVRLIEQQMCMLGSLCSSFFTVTEAIQDRLKLIMNDIEEWLIGVINEGVAEEAFNFVGEPKDKAKVILCSLVAGVQFTRALEEDYFTRLKHQLRLELNIHTND
ncbi:TetR/AcrR family transcriptional regulator [Fulvivirga sediminis]|uniref:TetR/AcrR family transcriptional regulator n=1 Tax=Fulvivirga sediminis TaxID=2803949 RepID=A0A937JXG1_9BACT|nr:TetR/AcrR family transcriptional regulator [Fulvivirga sediminis]MBL3654594.1 TetR/AcrR family transcriptional regulator [Fulvivirga sediminis]